jgi:predicted CXXCH cytochrome family protein
VKQKAERSTGRWLHIILYLFSASPGLLFTPAGAVAQAKNACLDCHAMLDAPMGVTAEQYAQDIHAQKGLTCTSCHGGDASSDDMEQSMSRAKGFRGKPSRRQIPQLCAQCHSNAAYMRQYNPSLRTDQLSQYLTSVHGKRLSQGDQSVAVCTDCHGVHGIRPATDPRSKVHPLNVATTCAACHANAEHMKSYKIPTDQFAGYQASVHHEALTVRGDLSAPTCSTCHGNHGATPPGVASVGFVCSTCHVFQAQLFDASPHKAAFAAMGAPACVVCHSNHRILHPTDQMLSTGKDSICLNCHSQGDAGFAAAEAMSKELRELDGAIARSDEILGRAERSGMEVSPAKVEQAQARDALTKARVTIHTVQTAKVEEDVRAGLAVAAKTYDVGVKALKERDYRRIGLAISLVTIAIVLLALQLYIREIEKPKSAAGESRPS